MVARTVLIISVVGCVLSGCIDGVEVDRMGWAVVSGEANDDDPGVVLLVNLSNGNGCTGVAISERVVLSAKHCFTEDSNPASWRVIVGYDPGPIETREAEYSVVEIRPAPGGVDPSSDLAVVLLQHDFEFPFYPYAFRAPSNLQAGRFSRFVGYGNTVWSDNETSGLRNERSGVITNVSENSLTSTVGVCYGDSGGPVFNRQDVVLGIAHDIVNENCEGDARFTRVDVWAEFIEESLAEMGACIPTSFDDVCDDNIDNECNGVIDDCTPPADGDGDGDSDGDGDGDGDSDGDGDGDGDGDADADGGVDGGGDGGPGSTDEGCSCGEASIATAAGGFLSIRSISGLLINF